MDEFNFFLVFVIAIAFYLGYIIGEAITLLKFRTHLRNLAEAMGIDVEKEIRIIEERVNDTKVVKVVNLETETHGEMIYLFNKEQNDFICQGKSIDELAKLAKEFKNINKAVVHHNDKKFIFVDGKSEEFNFQ